MIVSERGRHSDEARRVVRAQAARASAAQSRVTRARNREEREGAARDAPQSPASDENSQLAGSSQGENVGSPMDDKPSLPLVTWLSTILNQSPSALIENPQSSVASSLAASANVLASGARAGMPFGTGSSTGQSTGESNRPQLPLATPRGFVTLQQRIGISDGMMVLMKRTACFDYDSPGVQQRLCQLLVDLIVGHLGAAVSGTLNPGHPIQGHLRIACTCLTIFHGQRTNGAIFDESNYQNGLQAAGSEAMLLDQNALTEPKSAEASLWAVFIISATTGATANFFQNLLRELFEDLQLQYWSQVRSILLDFIYPSGFLDEPCKRFYDHFKEIQVGET